MTLSLTHMSQYGAQLALPFLELSHEEMDERLRAQIDIRHDPGTAFEISARPYANPKVEFLKQHSGLINIRWPWGTISPPDIPPPGNTRPPRSATLQAAQEILRPALAAAITAFLWETHQPNADFASKTALGMQKTAEDHPVAKALQFEIASLILNSLSGMADATIWDTTAYLNGTTPHWAYDTIALTAGAYIPMANTNPGIAAWTLQRRLAVAGMTHPGQLVSAARAAMHRDGIENSSWRFISQLTPATIRASKRSKAALQDTANVLNAMAATGSEPPPQYTGQFIIPFLRNLRNRGNAEHQRTHQHAVAWARHLTRGLAEGIHPSDYETAPQDLADYAAHLVQQNTIPSAGTNLRKLLCRSQRWHREARGPKEPLENHQILGWNSLLTTREIEDYEIVPLEDSEQLQLESDHLRHCVWTRAQECWDGRTRIFSYREDGHSKVTAEITLKGSAWTPGQTRRYKNAPPCAHDLAVTRRIAVEYQRIWENTSDPKHTRWTTPR